MTIEIRKPELEALILERMKLGGFQNAEDTNGEEKANAFVQWAKSHRATPPLSDESISRASLNPDRW